MKHGHIEAFRLRLARARQSGASDIRISVSEGEALLQELLDHAIRLRTDTETTLRLLEEIKRLNQRLERMDLSTVDGGEF